MKRRVNTLASSTAKKKSHWREEADDEEAMIPEGKAKKLSDLQFLGGKTLYCRVLKESGSVYFGRSEL